MSEISINSLSSEQKDVIYYLEQGRNIFVTGSAGTGKSYILRYIKQNYFNFGLHITASTGIAAINIGGKTLHSWSGIGLGNNSVEQITKDLFSPRKSKIRFRIKTAKILAIDEISMISARTLDLLDKVLQNVRQNSKAFGGLQLILFGDFFQLPPVRNNDDTRYYFAFHSQVWNELKLVNIFLKKTFRQKDLKFIELLNNIRHGKLTKEDVNLLQDRINIKGSENNIKATILVTHNSQAHRINKHELDKINSKSRTFQASFSGKKSQFEFLRKNCIANELLELKVGSQVMMIKNTYQKDGIINGSLGIVREFSGKKEYPVVEFANNKIVIVGPGTWEIEKLDSEKGEIISEAKMQQIPLILSWAITIHKSQGMTLDKVKCDLEYSFSPGQIYVALSRVRSLQDLHITSIDFNKIKINRDIKEFYDDLLL